ncbi:MAG: phosphate-starvation-inducible PsiE family protein, partial [Deltaproteobacteria bacterium]|nr:phosphate-starvation-inducible PsiE family protein [Deltaproteobacteria bacterium]
LDIGDILALFGAFMAVLIAIEILINIVIYLRDDVIHVKIVMATALMAIARKVIVLDFNKISANYVLAIAAVVLTMSVGYWLVVIKDSENGGIYCTDNVEKKQENNL